MIFVEFEDLSAIYPIYFGIQPEYIIDCKNAIYNSDYKTVSLEMKITIHEQIIEKRMIL
jgi:hypothetical protein